MLTTEENELITRVGPGTPMGEYLRRFWIPACLSEELPEPDGVPQRVRLLGENLVAFRDTNGRVGLMDEHCPHRGAALYLGRNEECGLRCLYHGWKYDVEGNVVDTPLEPPEATFTHWLKHHAYPTHEAGSLIWTYMGPTDHRPEFPNFAWMAHPATQRGVGKVLEECNFLQGVESTIDSPHLDSLHSGRVLSARESIKPPTLECEDTLYGFRYGAIRRPTAQRWTRTQQVDVHPEQFKHVRVTLFVLPFHCFTARGDYAIDPHMFVPIDDETTWFYDVHVSRDESIDISDYLGRRRLLRGKDLDENYRKYADIRNNYLQDREWMKDRTRRNWYTGIKFQNPHEDMAMIETMGPIYDRTREHLGATDAAVMHMRRLLIRAARTFEQSGEVVGLDPSIRYDLLGAQDALIPIDQPWQTVGNYAGEYEPAQPEPRGEHR